MAHQHYCRVCKIPVAVCNDESCFQPDGDGEFRHPNAGEHYCSIHHPDPAYRVDPIHPPGKEGMIVIDRQLRELRDEVSQLKCREGESK